MGTQGTRPGTTVRYRRQNSDLIFPAGMALLILTSGIWWASFSANVLVTGSAGPINFIGLVVGVLLIPAGLGLLLIAVRRPPLTLTPDMLRISRGLRTIRIPVSEITGVGLVCQRAWNTGQPGGPTSPWWRMKVWRRGDERGQAVLYFRYPALPPRRDRRVSKFDPATETDTALLEAQYAAQTARDLYQRVLALQGPAGLLAVTEQQKHVRAGSRLADAIVLAFWSPDGVLGRATPGPAHPAAR